MKISIITLIIVLVFALAVGACGKDDTSSAEEDGGMDVVVGGGANAPEGEMGWPAGIFPADFPAYPDGTVTSIDDSDKAKTVFIDGADKQAFDAYKAGLEGAGWVFDAGGESARKGFFMLVLAFSNGEVAITLIETDTEYVAPTEPGSGSPVDGPAFPASIEGWPKDLPYAVPAYPDGDIEYTAPDLDSDSPSFRIVVSNTSKESFDKYAAAMEGDGWETKGSTGNGFTFVKEGGQHVSILLVGDNKANIFVFVID